MEDLKQPNGPASPLAALIIDELARQMPFLLRATQSATPPLTERLPELEIIGQRLNTLRGDHKLWIPEAVKAYVMLSMEFLLLQKKLEKSGHYLLSSEKEAYDKVYNNPEIFTEYYLDGLLLSEALWPNQFLLNRLFADNFLSQIQPGWQIVEAGVGSGYHLRQLLTRQPDIHYFGIDISSFAIRYCQQFAGGVLEPTQERERVIFSQENIATCNNVEASSADALVLGEILEHVEDPVAVLGQMRKIAKPKAKMFMTTVIFAANIDHIYLFEHADEIREMTAQTGWATMSELVLPIYPTDNPDMSRRPMNYGAILAAN